MTSHEALSPVSTCHVLHRPGLPFTTFTPPPPPRQRNAVVSPPFHHSNVPYAINDRYPSHIAAHSQLGSAAPAFPQQRLAAQPEAFGCDFNQGRGVAAHYYALPGFADQVFDLRQRAVPIDFVSLLKLLFFLLGSILSGLVPRPLPLPVLLTVPAPAVLKPSIPWKSLALARYISEDSRPRGRL